MVKRGWCVAAIALGLVACKGTQTKQEVKSEPAGTGSGSAVPDQAGDAAVAEPGEDERPRSIGQLRRVLGLDGPKAPPTIDPNASARLSVHISGYDDKAEKLRNELRVYRIANGKLEQESATELAEGARVSMMTWRNAGELIVLLEGGELFTLSGGKLDPLARPPAKFFKAAKSGDARFNRDEALYATPSGEVWLHHCVWGYQGDNDPCSSDVHVRILPTPATAAKPPARRMAKGLAAPAGWTLTVTPVDHQTLMERIPKTGTLECKGPGGEAAKLEPRPDDQFFGYSVEDGAWLSHQPPIALIRDWTAGADEAMATARYLTGCTLVEDIEANYVVTGPNGFWAVDWLETSGDTATITPTSTAVLWHGRTVDVIEAANHPLFAP